MTLLVCICTTFLCTDGDARNHERDLQKVFDHLRQHKLHAKLKKCDFGKDRLKYLGHVVGSGKLRVDEDKIVAVADAPFSFH